MVEQIHSFTTFDEVIENTCKPLIDHGHTLETALTDPKYVALLDFWRWLATTHELDMKRFNLLAIYNPSLTMGIETETAPPKDPLIQEQDKAKALSDLRIAEIELAQINGQIREKSIASPSYASCFQTLDDILKSKLEIGLPQLVGLSNSKYHRLSQEFGTTIRAYQERFAKPAQ